MELAKNLKGHLMLIVGGMDGNVHPVQTIRMVDAFINHGKDVEFVLCHAGGTRMMGFLPGILRISCVRFCKIFVGGF